MKSKGIKYIIAFLLLFLFLMKGAMPFLHAVVSEKDIIEMVAEMETEENKKSTRQIAETGIQELYAPLNYFTDLNGSEVMPPSIIPSWQNTVYKQKVFIAIPTPPPKQA